MQLSAPTLPYDPTPLPPSGAAPVPAGGSAYGDPAATTGNFGALLTAETGAKPGASAANGDKSFSSDRDRAAAHGTDLSGDPTTADAAVPVRRPAVPAAVAANPELLAGWLAANGFSQPPPKEVAPPAAGSVAPSGQIAIGGADTSAMSGSAPGGADKAMVLPAGEGGSGGVGRVFPLPGGLPRGAQVRAAYAGGADPRTAGTAAATGGLVSGVATGTAASAGPGRLVGGQPPGVPSAAGAPPPGSFPEGGAAGGPGAPGQPAPVAGAVRLPAGAPAVAPPAVASSDVQILVTADAAVSGPGRSRPPATASVAGGRRENIAAGPGALPAGSGIQKSSDLKKSLVNVGERVANGSSDLGINVAKTRDAMTALAPSPDRPPTESVPPTFSMPSLDFNAIAKQPPPASGSELAAAARSTVDSVLAVTDHFTTGGQHGVNLKFSVSGVDLAVRVEIRGGNIQTTFRTDSPELRAALATEWHAVTAAQPGDRSQRLADPVFTSSSTAGGSLQADSGAADQRGSGARPGQPAPDEFSAPGAGRRQATAVTTASVPARLAPVSLPGRLHTFA